MLDAFIIEELRRREREQDRHADNNRLRLPVPGRDDEAYRRRPQEQPERAEPSRAEFPLDDARDANVVDFTF